jgi:hypothetical protein
MTKQQAWVLIVIVAVAMGAIVQTNRYKYIERTLGNLGVEILTDIILDRDYAYRAFLRPAKFRQSSV